MAIYVTFDRNTQKYAIKQKSLEHNHPTGPEEFSMYSTERQPKGLLADQMKMLLAHGANPTLVTGTLNMNGLKTKPRDVHNMQQKMKQKGIHII